ncbi:MAG: PIN domain-containing protein [Syntrophobacteraceae bacterium]
MLKVVVDTNVLVSALLKPDSVPELVLSLVLSGKIILCSVGAHRHRI